jgi:hypothetical protein
MQASLKGCPWLGLNTDKHGCNKLATKLAVYHCPAFVIVSATGEIVNPAARAAVFDDPLG